MCTYCGNETQGGGGVSYFSRRGSQKDLPCCMTQNSSSLHLVQIVLYGGFKKISSPGGGLSLVLAILQNFLKSTGGLVNNNPDWGHSPSRSEPCHYTGNGLRHVTISRDRACTSTSGP